MSSSRARLRLHQGRVVAGVRGLRQSSIMTTCKACALIADIAGRAARVKDIDMATSLVFMEIAQIAGRPPYEEAVKRRLSGVCCCNLDDRECYRRGHWEARP